MTSSGSIRTSFPCLGLLGDGEIAEGDLASAAEPFKRLDRLGAAFILTVDERLDCPEIESIE